jgi:D-arabinose 1-dehydrogenase-like Zn-dependent alcohol dehydrogenase
MILVTLRYSAVRTRQARPSEGQKFVGIGGLGFGVVEGAIMSKKPEQY